MREAERLTAAAAEVEPSAPGVVMTTRGERMSRVTTAAISIRRRQARAHIVIVTTQRFEPIDLAHDRGPLRAARRDALAVHAIGDEGAHLVRGGAEQKGRGGL